MAGGRTRAAEATALMQEAHRLLDEPGCSISFSPAKSGNLMMYCNGDFIGGLFDGELCLVYTDAAAELLGRPEPVYRGYSSEALHRMLLVPFDMAKEALRLTKLETLSWKEYVYDIAAVSVGASVLEDFYDENAVFLRFCHENGLLQKPALDGRGRIIRTFFIKRDLTGDGRKYFTRLLGKFLAFCDRNGKTPLEKMLPRWLAALKKKS